MDTHTHISLCEIGCTSLLYRALTSERSLNVSICVWVIIHALYNQTHRHTQTHTHTQTHLHKRKHKQTHTTFAYTQTHTHAQPTSIHKLTHTHTLTHMHTHNLTHTHAYITHIHTHKLSDTLARAHTCTYVSRSHINTTLPLRFQLRESVRVQVPVRGIPLQCCCCASRKWTHFRSICL